MAMLQVHPLPGARVNLLRSNPNSHLSRTSTITIFKTNSSCFNFYPSIFFLSDSYQIYPLRKQILKSHISLLLQLTASAAILLLGFSARAVVTPISCPPIGTCQSLQETEPAHSEDVISDKTQSKQIKSSGFLKEKEEEVDEECKAAFEKWKSKTYSLTVPLKIVALRGSIPPSWLKDFLQVQGKRSKLQTELRGSFEDIYSDLIAATNKGNLTTKSAMSADIITMGDSWLSLAIKEGVIEPIEGAEDQDWFNNLSEKWKLYLRRNEKGNLDSDGKIWGAPYRWGCMVIAYKKNKFRKQNYAPIEDWGDLLRPELAGKISMVDSPREVTGLILKYMGASYNTKDMQSQVKGGRNAVLQNLLRLQKQVRLFDSANYLKSFQVGDVWVAVGWSSDILPMAKRMSNVAVIVPKSGSSLWADLWVVPAATKFTATNQIGGRVRSPSPLIHQWIEFCSQTARAFPFQQEIIPGASPSSLENIPNAVSPVDFKGKPKLDTNLVSGIPPSEILKKCEFFEPLAEATLVDYNWLISQMQKPGCHWIRILTEFISSRFWTSFLNLSLR